MQALAATGTARIARVRLHTGAPDALAQRLHASALIERASLGSGGLPAQAVLVLRRLQAPLPLALWRQGGAGFADWQGRLRAQVDQAGRHAVRVVQGGVPADAPAVWFADQAELLACLARDGLEGRCRALWWWCVLYGARAPSWSVGSAWIAAPRFVPEAFHQLAQTGQAARFVSTLAAAEVDKLTQALCACHGLPASAPWAATVGLAALPSASAVDPARDGPMAVESAGDAGGVSAGLAPAITALLSATRGLDAPRAALLAVALALVQSPRLARQAHFAQTLAAALAARSRAAPAAKTELPATPARLESPRPRPGQARPHGVSLLPAPEPGPAASLRASNAAGAVGFAAAAWAGSAASQSDFPRQECGTPASVASPALRALEERGDIPRAGLPAAPVPREAHQPQPLLATPYGGVFFLVNLALSLGLYCDFTQPRGDNLALPLWDLLALCADRWFADEERDIPLHGLLAQLAGRDAAEPAGTGFEPPGEWRLPLPWLQPWAAQRGAWRWHECGGRLKLCHPAGFLVLDVQRSAVAVRRQLATEVAPYRAAQRLRLWPQPQAQEPQQAGRAWHRWCEALMPFLAHRLARAVGLQDSSAATRQVCAVPARIALTPARLDVHIRLRDLPIAVRCAGLDRDPGWIPGAGRDLRFHFSADGDGPVA